MQGYEIRFNVYAQSEQEAQAATAAIKDFISSMAQKGIAVTAVRLQEAVMRWKDNVFVTNYFK